MGYPMFRRYSVSANNSQHFSHILLMGYPMFRRYSDSVKNITINFRYIEMVIY